MKSLLFLILFANLGLITFSDSAYSASPATVPTSVPLVAAAGPPFSRIVRTLESQHLGDKAQLVYFDQSVSDAMGLHVPPGRVGIVDFDQAILKKLGIEVKQASQVLSSVAGNLDEHGNPYIFVEEDAMGGSGRAGYFEVEPGVWVNVKGIGVTGAGNTSDMHPNPPQNEYSSHHDGSATLEESVKESVMARVADEETSTGGSRILAIIYTGRTLKYPDGKLVPLALIVRVPLRRYDQPGGSAAQVASSLAEANSKRLLKGDFVNRSNMGAEGEWVDFGTMTFTEGYAPLQSSQDDKFLFEGSSYLPSDAPRDIYLLGLGKGLIQQMGIPEAQLAKLGLTTTEMKEKLTNLATTFTSSVYWVKGQPNGVAQATLLDYQHVSDEALLGNVHFNHYFQSAAKNYFQTSNHEEAFNQELQRLLSMTNDRDDDLVKKLSNFVRETQDFFELVAKTNQITNRTAYGENIGKVAAFKNRDLFDLVRPNLFNNAGSLANQFADNHNPYPISDFIDETVVRNHFETNAVSDARMLVSTDTKSTKIHLRAYEDAGRIKKLFAYPDLPGAKRDEAFSFRVTTDGWKSHKDIPGRFVTTKVGDYFEIDIPHGSMPVTSEQVQISPFVREASGGIRWMGNNFNLVGPPLLLNQRVDLPESFIHKEGIMRRTYNMKSSILSDDLIPYGSSCDLNLMHPKP